jgi:hypothetical protein
MTLEKIGLNSPGLSANKDRTLLQEENGRPLSAIANII